MPWHDFEREYDEARDRMARQRRVVSIGFGLVSGCIIALIVIALYLLIRSPEAVGAWLGRIAAGFRGAA